MSRHLIIGGGPAGLAALDTLREFGDEGPVTIVSDEPPYSRMVLPYFMDGTIPEENVFTAEESYLRERNAEGMFGRSVVGLDPAGKANLDDGTSVEFDDALIATGSSPTRPPIPGASGAGIFNLWRLDDAQALIECRGGEVAVIGAGFIAFTCLDAFIALGARVTVIEVEDQILPRMVDSVGAQMVQGWLESKGVEFRTGAAVTEIADRAGRKHLSIDGGDDVEADVVVMATGIRPNLAPAEAAGLEIDLGIVVDDHLRSSSANIFAAGDVAQGPVIGSEQKGVHAIEPTAIEHGRIAGANMAGADIAYWGSMLVNIVDVQKLQIASFGLWSDEGREARTVVNQSGPIYRKMIFEEDRMVGAIMLGGPNDVAMLNDMGMIKGLIQTQSPLGEWRKYLDRNPLDVRRPYVASRAAEKLLQRRLLNRPSTPDGYRRPDPPPRYWPHHSIFVSTKPSD